MRRSSRKLQILLMLTLRTSRRDNYGDTTRSFRITHLLMFLSGCPYRIAILSPMLLTTSSGLIFIGSGSLHCIGKLDQISRFLKPTSFLCTAVFAGIRLSPMIARIPYGGGFKLDDTSLHFPKHGHLKFMSGFNCTPLIHGLWLIMSPSGRRYREIEKNAKMIAN